MSDPLAMFPLGSVLLPGMPVALRVFEPRFLAMLAEITATDRPDFGVVLIERGHEVGGNDSRFSHATVARLVQVEAGEGSVGVVAVGGRRVRVRQWLPDDPYPRAEVETLPDLVWDEQWRPALDAAVETVTTARDTLWGDAHDVVLPDDPLDACWHLAAAAPVGPLDRLAMLRTTDVGELLDVVGETTAQVVQLQQAFDG